MRSTTPAIEHSTIRHRARRTSRTPNSGRVLTAMADEPVEIGELEGRPDRSRYVFADKAALMVAMGKHSTEDPWPSPGGPAHDRAATHPASVMCGGRSHGYSLGTW